MISNECFIYPCIAFSTDLYFSSLIMVSLWNRADHYVFALSFVLSIYFPRLISAVADWMSAILPHMVWP